MDNGWIKIHRKLLDWEWWDDHNTSRLFFYLILKANHKPKNWRGIIIERGQVLTGRTSLSKKTGITEQSIRTSLTRLKSTNEITIKSTNKYSIITVCKYETYQISEETTNQQLTTQLTINQPTTNQQLTTNKNVKNEKNEKKYIKENVSMTEMEHQKLIEKYGRENTEKMLEKLDNYKGSKGKKYKSDYRAILSWVVDEVLKQDINTQMPNKWDRNYYEKCTPTGQQIYRHHLEQLNFKKKQDGRGQIYYHK